MEEIGWNEERQAFVDPNEDQMFSIFKLYPWEIMLDEEFGVHTLATYPDMRWIEPIWKLLLSNKGILPILWQLYPNHELLLEAHFDTAPEASTGGWQQVNTNGANTPTILPAAAHKLRNYVRKPLYSREGANVTIVREGSTIASTDGPYHGRQIVQALAPEAVFPGPNGSKRYPVLGLWMIDQTCSGLGIRESATPVTDNYSSFIPHYFL